MIYKERLFRVLGAPIFSEKASITLEKTNTVVFEIAMNAKKKEVKAAIQELFSIKVKNVNTLIVKGKVQRHGQRTGKHSNWKKAYITLKEGQHPNFIFNSSE